MIDKFEKVDEITIMNGKFYSDAMVDKNTMIYFNNQYDFSTRGVKAKELFDYVINADKLVNKISKDNVKLMQAELDGISGAFGELSNRLKELEEENRKLKEVIKIVNK